MTRYDENDTGISLHHILIQEGLVASTDEAAAIIESIIQESSFYSGSDDSETNEIINHESFYRYVLCDYFGLNDCDVARILAAMKNEANHDHTDRSEVVECEHILLDEVDDDQEEVVGPGECELCERDVAKLTRHHLIPKSTWKRTEPMLLSRWNKAVTESSTTATKANYSNRADPDELEHLVPIILEKSSTIPSCKTLHGRQAAPGKRIIRDLLNNQTIDLCRPCHNHIHRSYDNRTLALQFNTLDKLLKDPTIFKYAKWASRQHRFKIR